ncbi:Zinc finger, BED-type [Dillenia turbinata]|uniref:Zinc finger, BED-type n=1 Tax=Dillenia turbinata TaxID=194707 RepID=A0AAN8Z0C5_9MAGN
MPPTLQMSSMGQNVEHDVTVENPSNLPPCSTQPLPFAVPEQATNSMKPPLPKVRMKKSSAWNHFNEVEGYPKYDKKTSCKYCKTLIGCSSPKGTTPLYNHMARCKKYPYNVWKLWGLSKANREFLSSKEWKPWATRILTQAVGNPMVADLVGLEEVEFFGSILDFASRRAWLPIDKSSKGRGESGGLDLSEHSQECNCLRWDKVMIDGKDKNDVLSRDRIQRIYRQLHNLLVREALLHPDG